MARGEGRLAGAVGAGVPDEDFVENEIGGSHEDERGEHFDEWAVDFFEGFAGDPLVETKHGEKAEYGDGGD